MIVAFTTMHRSEEKQIKNTNLHKAFLPPIMNAKIKRHLYIIIIKPQNCDTADIKRSAVAVMFCIYLSSASHRLEIEI